MPYKSEKIKLSREQDRRVKLSDEQREEIKKKFELGIYSQRALAREYNVSRRLISFILFPDKAELAKEQLKERKADGRYKPSKEQWAATVREHRRYKQELYKAGKLTENQEEDYVKE